MARHWIATLALALAACTPMQWLRSDVTPEQAAADEELCREAAWREASFVYADYGAFGPWMNRDVFGRPLFYPPAGPFFSAARSCARTARRARVCSRRVSLL